MDSEGSFPAPSFLHSGCQTYSLVKPIRAVRNQYRPLTTGNSPYDQKRFHARRDRLGQRSIRRFMGQILLASEESQERPPFARDVVADRPAQHRIAGLERVQDRALRGLTLDL